MTEIKARIDAYFAHPNASQATRKSGTGWIPQEMKRESELLDYFKRADNGADDRNPASGQIEVHHPEFAFGLRTRHIANWAGNTVLRQETSYLRNSETAPPWFNTRAETTFGENATVKRTAVEGPQDVRVRTMVLDHTDPAKSYMDEFIIAR